MPSDVTDCWLKAVLIACVVLALLCSVPLFAENQLPDASSASPEFSQEEELMILEIFFDRQSAGVHRCYRIADEFWFPFALFQQYAPLPESCSHLSGAVFRTTLGTIEFDPAILRVIEGQAFISYEGLKNNLHIHTLFNKSIYAVKFIVPWRILTKRQPRAVPAERTPDIAAPDNVLSFLHMESQWSYAVPASRYGYLELEAGGGVAGGLWDMTGSGDLAGKPVLSQFHWTTISKHAALRIGTGSSQHYSLLESMPYSGIQFAWNNRDILPNIDNDRNTRSDVFLNLDRNQRRSIEGLGPSGGIAELRFDDYIVARQRIPFNRKFVFRNVRMNADPRVIEVYLYDHSIYEKPSRIVDYTRSVSSRSLADGEMLVHGSAGFSGNILADDNRHEGWTGSGAFLYGLSDRLTLEASLQKHPESDSIDGLIGTILSIGPEWNSSLYGAWSHGGPAIDFSLFGYGNAWRFTQRTQWNGRKFGYASGSGRQKHAMRLQVRPFSWLNTLLYGYYSKEGGADDVASLLPGGTVLLSSWLSVSAAPDDEKGDYRYEANIRVLQDMDVRLRYDQNVLTTDLGYDIDNNHSVQFLHFVTPQTGQQALNASWYWHPGGDYGSRVRLGLSQSSRGVGISGSWSKDFNVGLNAVLAFNNNMNQAGSLFIDEDNLPGDDYTKCAVSFALKWDLGRSSRRFYPIERSAINYTRGGLTGSLKIKKVDGLEGYSVDDAAILINGRKLGQRQTGGTFFIGNLKPGLYTVSVDPEHLPVELVADRQHQVVEVKSGDITEVELLLKEEYGVAGKVCTQSGTPLLQLPVSIVDTQGAVVTTSATDEFGYYRVDGLEAGAYVVRVSLPLGESGVTLFERACNISDDFLFGIDIVVPEQCQ